MPAVHGLAHVIDGERRDHRSRHRLHLDAGAAADATSSGYLHRIVGGVAGEFEGNGGQRQRVAQRNEVGRALSRHDFGEPGDAENITLADRAGRDHRQRFRAHQHPRPGGRRPVRNVFGGNIDHTGVAGWIEVTRPTMPFALSAHRKIHHTGDATSPSVQRQCGRTRVTVHKVSIIPRGVGALGYTISGPTEYRF